MYHVVQARICLVFIADHPCTATARISGSTMIFVRFRSSKRHERVIKNIYKVLWPDCD